MTSQSNMHQTTTVTPRGEGVDFIGKMVPISIRNKEPGLRYLQVGSCWPTCLADGDVLLQLGHSLQC